eukprot:6602712-Lingulodinium_polyedra.AAC.1
MSCHDMLCDGTQCNDRSDLHHKQKDLCVALHLLQTGAASNDTTGTCSWCSHFVSSCSWCLAGGGHTEA